MRRPPSRLSSDAGRLGAGALLALWGTVALILLHLTALPAATAQTPEPRLHVTADTVQIGERFTVALAVPHEPAKAVQFPGLDDADAPFGDLDVLDRSDVYASAHASAPGLQVDSVAYEVTTFALDTAEIPPVPVRLITEDDTTTVTADVHTVVVQSVVAEDDDALRDLAGLAEFPRPLWSWLAAALAAAALVGLLYYGWKRRQQKPLNGTAPPSAPPPYDEARDRLDRLADALPASPHDVQAFYADLARTLRAYLARRSRVPALERTTRELVDALDDRSPLSGECVTRLHALLRQADLVKFADVRPDTDDCRTSLDAAHTLLEHMEAQWPEETTDSSNDPPDGTRTDAA